MLAIHATAAHLIQMHRGHLRVRAVRTLGLRTEKVLDLLGLVPTNQESEREREALTQ